MQFPIPTPRALPAAWGLESRAVPRRARALLGEALRPGVGEGRGCLSPLVPLAVPALGKGRRGRGAGARSLLQIAGSARGTGLLCGRFLPAFAVGWELTDGHCCTRSDQTPSSPRDLELSSALYLFIFNSLSISPNEV